MIITIMIRLMVCGFLVASCNEPWWVWLIVGLTISLAIVITVGSFFMIKRCVCKYNLFSLASSSYPVVMLLRI